MLYYDRTDISEGNDVNPIQDGGRQKFPLTCQFFPCKFCKRRNYNPKPSDFYFQPVFPNWCKILQLHLVSVPNY